jgi:hypothetical protein
MAVDLRDTNPNTSSDNSLAQDSPQVSTVIATTFCFGGCPNHTCASSSGIVVLYVVVVQLH